MFFVGQIESVCWMGISINREVQVLNTDVENVHSYYPTTFTIPLIRNNASLPTAIKERPSAHHKDDSNITRCHGSWYFSTNYERLTSKLYCTRRNNFENFNGNTNCFNLKKKTITRQWQWHSRLRRLSKHTTKTNKFQKNWCSKKIKTTGL